jgi:hypothetical protein
MPLVSAVHTIRSSLPEFDVHFQFEDKEMICFLSAPLTTKNYESRSYAFLIIRDSRIVKEKKHSA